MSKKYKENQTEEKKVVVLMTGSLTVYSNNTSIVDKSCREEQYRSSILLWLQNKFVEKLVFCENTLAIEKFVDIENKYKERFEYITFLGDINQIKCKGKGFGEGEIIKYALENSLTLKQSSSFFKITGRLYIENFSSILKDVDYKKNFFMMTYVRFLAKNNNVDTKFYFVQKNFYLNYLLNEYKKTNDSKGWFIEHQFYATLKNMNTKHFKKLPFVVGFSGSTGRPYSKKGIIYFIKNTLCRYGFYSVS